MSSSLLAIQTSRYFHVCDTTKGADKQMTCSQYASCLASVVFCTAWNSFYYVMLHPISSGSLFLDIFQIPLAKNAEHCAFKLSSPFYSILNVRCLQCL